ncbi:MAG: hypothetical protein R3F62_08545 [Planctomycetota bacterium]
MNSEIQSLINLYRFPTGRAGLSLSRMLVALEDTTLDKLKARIQRALAENEATQRLELRWQAQRDKKEHAAGVMQLHQELNRTLSALFDNLAATATALGDDSERGLAAERAKAALFPVDLSALARRPFAEEASAVKVMLGFVRDDPQLARALRSLGVQEILDRLVELHARFEGALHEPRGVQYSEVVEARERDHQLLTRVVLSVMNTIVEREEEGEEVQGLNAALRTVIEQQEAIHRYYRRRRKVSDVDRETGEELVPLETEEDGVEDDVESDSEDVPEVAGIEGVASPRILGDEERESEAA